VYVDVDPCWARASRALMTVVFLKRAPLWAGPGFDGGSKSAGKIPPDFRSSVCPSDGILP
jgi:hypothetical protein